MADHANIDSIDALREFRAALIKFSESAKVAMGDAESELGRTVMWLETEMTTYWTGQVRKRKEVLGRATEKLREKRTFKDASGKLPSAVDEEKAVRVAQRRLEEAEAKLNATRRYVRVLQKAQDDYKGSVQGFATHVAHDVPVAVARLDKLSDLLHRYVHLSAPASREAGAGAIAPSSEGMARPAERITVDSHELNDFPSFDDPQVALVQSHKPTGLILAAEGSQPADDGNQYRLFASLADADAFARSRVAADRHIACTIYASDRHVLDTVEAEEPLAPSEPQSPASEG